MEVSTAIQAGASLTLPTHQQEISFILAEYLLNAMRIEANMDVHQTTSLLRHGEEVHPSTVGRGKAVVLDTIRERKWSNSAITCYHGDSLDSYAVGNS